MKQKNIIKLFATAVLCLGQTACVDLDQEPLASVPAEVYFNTDAQLQSYVDNLYAPRTGSSSNDQTFDVHSNWSYGTFAIDRNTDNMATKSADNQWIPALHKVGATGGDWSFGFIYKCNYFFKFVLPKYEAGTITGNQSNVKHVIGEAYFFRAYEYFKKVQALGDFPIVTELLSDDMAILMEQSIRRPRTDVVHFILDDLDKAIALMDNDGSVSKTRITQKAALLFKSRVALYEGTWLKYFQNTAFVPNGPGWPGATQHADYQFPKGNIQDEINYLLGEAMDAAKKVASTTELVTNHSIPDFKTQPNNDYLSMFGAENMSNYSEVIFWKQYSRGLGITHNVAIAVHSGCYQTGLTRAYVDNFLMDDGRPIYAAEDDKYKGDNYIAEVVQNRDGRLQLFLKVPGQLNYFQAGTLPERVLRPEELFPNIAEGNGEVGYSTGYTIRKGINFTYDQMNNNGGCYTGSLVFRAVEAYLNYIEASYERNGLLDTDAQNYWTQIRNRANPGITSNYSTTIGNTDMTEEAKNDWGAYSGGDILEDKILYNIRRERRMELMAEGLRMMDLKRWRALDQLIGKYYHIEGIKLWGPMKSQYPSAYPALKYDQGGDSNVSRPELMYIRPNEFNPNADVTRQGGYTWKMAHYLSPIAAEHFLVTSNDGVDANTSTIYQNPYWSMDANTNADQ
jgi:hypothetical protein